MDQEARYTGVVGEGSIDALRSLLFCHTRLITAEVRAGKIWAIVKTTSPKPGDSGYCARVQQERLLENGYQTSDRNSLIDLLTKGGFAYSLEKNGVKL